MNYYYCRNWTRNPKLVAGNFISIFNKFILLLCVLLAEPVISADKIRNTKSIIPAYISDNHGKSFYFLAEKIEWNNQYTLLLFDIHSDSRSIVNSDFIRDTLKNNHQINTSPTYQKWQQEGIIQCYNWIEPLIPHPIIKVIWVPSHTLTRDEKYKKYNEIKKLINADQEISERNINDLSSFYNVLSFEELKNYNFKDTPLICSIDLDYFKDKNDIQNSDEIKNLFKLISKTNLHALTIAVSRPYMSSDYESDYLLYHSLQNLFSIINSNIQIDLLHNPEPDRSDLALLFRKKNKTIPYYNIQQSSSLMKSLLLRNKYRYKIKSNSDEWEKVITSWEKSEKKFDLELFADTKKIESSRTGFFDFISGDNYYVTIPDVTSYNNISWYTYKPLSSSYNISPSNIFAKDAPSVLYYEPVIISSLTDKKVITNKDLIPLFNTQNNCGTVRLFCIISESNNQYISESVTITQRKDNTYTGYLTAQMNLPYIFGGTLLQQNNLHSADLLYGAECSTFLIYGRKASGMSINYGDPKKLLNQSRVVYENINFREGNAYCKSIPVSISDKDIRNGLILHFGMHVAALYTDKAPYGILNDNDLVIHHLEGYPEIVTLSKIRRNRILNYILTFY